MNMITAIVLTYNEELHIERCISSLMEVCEKVYVVDSFSSDSTCLIAEKCGAVVLQNKYVNQAQQFQWALDNCPVDSEWTMRLDADEYLTDNLVAEINSQLPVLKKEVSGINLMLRVKFMGHVMRFGAIRPVKVIRIWRTGKAHMEQRWMDERMVLTGGGTITFKHHFVDENLNGLTAWTQKHNNYSNREILVELDRKYNLFREGASETLKSRNRQKVSYYRLPKFIRAFFYFFTRYIFFLGFLDGVPGLIWHTLQAYWYRFLVDSKMYEIEKRLGKNPSREQIVEYIERFYGISVKDG